MNYLNPYNFYFELPLYTAIEITTETLNDFKSFVSFEGRIDAYNPFLGEQSTFVVSIQRHYDKQYVTPTYFDKTTVTYLTCRRSDLRFEYYFITYKKKNSDNYTLIKIGQFPSIADLHISQIKDFSKVLSKEKLKELTKSIGLAANGVGIGSFVYLRRVFEHLIEEAHTKIKKTSGWDETIYQRSRMNDKIQILKNELPDFLVEHKEMYGILSKGVHELEEQECLMHFLPIKTGIEMILEDKVIELEKNAKRTKASDAIKEIASKINQQKK